MLICDIQLKCISGSLYIKKKIKSYTYITEIMKENGYMTGDF